MVTARSVVRFWRHRWTGKWKYGAEYIMASAPKHLSYLSASEGTSSLLAIGWSAFTLVIILLDHAILEFSGKVAALDRGSGEG